LTYTTRLYHWLELSKDYIQETLNFVCREYVMTTAMFVLTGGSRSFRASAHIVKSLAAILIFQTVEDWREKESFTVGVNDRQKEG